MPLGFEDHDHNACITSGMQHAEEICRTKGLRFTPVRKRSLEILLSQHRAIGAYDLLEQLAAEGLGTKPPTAYRALDFLVSAGLAHRIEALNAYIACSHFGDDDHAPAFLICRSCRSVAETGALPTGGRLRETAKATGFVIERTVVEAEGLCPACSGGAA